MCMYKGHRIEITECGDDDCSKACHSVWLPSGERLTADITPYDWSVETVELWIDAGYPKRGDGPSPIGPLRREDLVMAYDNRCNECAELEETCQRCRINTALAAYREP